MRYVTYGMLVRGIVLMGWLVVSVPCLGAAGEENDVELGGDNAAEWHRPDPRTSWYACLRECALDFRSRHHDARRKTEISFGFLIGGTVLSLYGIGSYAMNPQDCRVTATLAEVSLLCMGAGACGVARYARRWRESLNAHYAWGPLADDDL